MKKEERLQKEKEYLEKLKKLLKKRNLSSKTDNCSIIKTRLLMPLRKQICPKKLGRIIIRNL